MRVTAFWGILGLPKTVMNSTQEAQSSGVRTLQSLRCLPLLVFGAGDVGRALLHQVLEHRRFHRERYGLRLEVVCVSDSSGWLSPPPGDAGDAAIRQALQHKQAGGHLSELKGSQPALEPRELVDRLCPPGGIVVDCTASLSTVPALTAALERGAKIVLANKKPLTVEQEIFDRLTADPAASRWETTVGSCLPIITALNRIIASGDEVQSIAGTFSGTLGFLTTRLQEGTPFSRLIRQAWEAGFTEPDPREDLSGVDVARKSLILARGAGWKLDLKDISVQGVMPSEFPGTPMEEFLDAIASLDDYFSVRVRAAHKRGTVLRYVAEIQKGRCRVGLVEVNQDSPLGRLRGNDNLVEIYTRLYDPHPLLVQGRGAGVAATAAGVLSDIVELAFTR